MGPLRGVHHSTGWVSLVNKWQRVPTDRTRRSTSYRLLVTKHIRQIEKSVKSILPFRPGTIGKIRLSSTESDTIWPQEFEIVHNLNWSSERFCIEGSQRLITHTPDLNVKKLYPNQRQWVRAHITVLVSNDVGVWVLEFVRRVEWEVSSTLLSVNGCTYRLKKIKISVPEWYNGPDY